MPLHRQLILAGLAMITALATSRLRAPIPRMAPTTCAHPVAVHHRGRMSILCAPADATALSVLMTRLTKSQCTADAGVTVHAGELLRVGPGCRRRLEPMPAGLRLTLGLPLDLNQASPEALRALPRIGPVLARRIVEDRRLRGPFPSLETLSRVPGIGPRTVQGLRGLISVHAGSGVQTRRPQCSDGSCQRPSK